MDFGSCVFHIVLRTYKKMAPNSTNIASYCRVVKAAAGKKNHNFLKSRPERGKTQKKSAPPEPARRSGNTVGTMPQSGVTVKTSAFSAVATTGVPLARATSEHAVISRVESPRSSMTLPRPPAGMARYTVPFLPTSEAFARVPFC